MPTCDGCESHVSAAFARVFGDPETGVVARCVECAASGGEIAGGEL